MGRVATPGTSLANVFLHQLGTSSVRSECERRLSALRIKEMFGDTLKRPGASFSLRDMRRRLRHAAIGPEHLPLGIAHEEKLLLAQFLPNRKDH